MVTWLLACDVDPDGEPNAQQPVISVCNAVDIAALFVAAGATMSAESIARFDADAIAAAGEDARRKLCRARFLLMRYRALEIATALQFLKLPALVTLYILDAAHQLAPKVPMHLKWTLVTKVKHFIRVTK